MIMNSVGRENPQWVCVVPPIDEEFKNALDTFLHSLSDEKLTFHISEAEIASSELFLARVTDGEIIGLAGIHRVLGLPLVYICVRTPYQRMGIGKELLRRLHEYAIGRFPFLMLKVMRSNKVAEHMYRRLGYLAFARTPRDYFMIKPLSSMGRGTFYLSILLGPLAGAMSYLKQRRKVRSSDIEPRHTGGCGEGKWWRRRSK